MIIVGDCVEVMRSMGENSIDAIVTDPPYLLEFMSKEFDRQHKGMDGDNAGQKMEAWHASWAREALRVLKPGGHLLAFSGSRTYHRMACAIEDAGFEIRDQIVNYHDSTRNERAFLDGLNDEQRSALAAVADDRSPLGQLFWNYGSGFPKSLDVSKAIDKQRDDGADVQCVRAWLEARRSEAGITRKAINEAMGLAGNGGGLASSWTTNNTTACIPQWEQWLQLKDLLGFGDDLDAEVWRLNGRKGKPGDAWQSAEVLETREALDIRNGHGRECGGAMFAGEKTGKITLEKKAPASDAAREWEGWGTALKPAHEPIVLARKPLAASTVAGNVLEFGTGALNIDGCRVPSLTGQRPSGDDRWVKEQSLCASCVEHAEKNRKPGTPGTVASIAIKPAEQTLNVKGATNQPDISRLDTGCSDGTRAANTDTGSNTVESGLTPTDQSHRDTRFTIETRISQTTGSKTCASCGAVITESCISESTRPERKNLRLGGSSNGNSDSAARWPANLIHDGSDQIEAAFAAFGERKGFAGQNDLKTTESAYFGAHKQPGRREGIGDTGTASRFFVKCPPDTPLERGEGTRFRYEAKAGRSERWKHLACACGTAVIDHADARYGLKTCQDCATEFKVTAHPTQKPESLMRYLVRLVTPPGGTVLDPFCGSGSTGRGAIMEGFEFVGIEIDPEYAKIAESRIEAAKSKPNGKSKKVDVNSTSDMAQETLAFWDE